MPRGGARPGAGRKPGGATKKDLSEAAIAILNDAPFLEPEGGDGFSTLQPLDIMLAMSRNLARMSSKLIERSTDDNPELSRTDRRELQSQSLRFALLAHKCASDAAPYVHGRMPQAPPPAVGDDANDRLPLTRLGSDPISTELAQNMEKWRPRT